MSRVVVVDNDPGALELVLFDLRLEGHDIVATADNGERAIAACLEARPDVAVLDFRLGPGLDGLDVAERVHAESPSTRLILHTNYVSPALVARAHAVGAAVVEKGSLRALRKAVAQRPAS